MSGNTQTTRLSKKLAKDDTPSVAWLQRLRIRDELTISNNSGDSDVFRPGDCVFIKHPDIDQDSPLVGHQYWKAQLLSIHTFKTKPWLCVRWFYSATQLEEEGHQIAELGSLGNTELVLTDHEDAVPADCIEDHCKIIKFDDMDVKAEWLHPAAWFYRLECEFKPNEVPSFQGVNLTCTCEKMYCPTLDSQRYCTKCSEWFHIDCMELAQPETRRLAFKPAPQQLVDVPIMRGWNGARKGKPWETVGTGRKLATLNAWLAKDVLPEDWRQQLDEGFVEAMTKKAWALYTCPMCSAEI